MRDLSFQPEILDTAIRRIQKMELCFDALRNTPASVRTTACFQALLKSFLQYYEGGQWLSDFELDEQGKLPRDLKRGVLSEDGVYNFLTDLDATNVK